MESPPKIQLLLNDRLIQEMPIQGESLRIGRMKENDLVVNNLAVSRFHAVLKVGTGGVLWLEDLGSENGTLVNGERIAGSAGVCEGDDITIGKHKLRITGMVTGDPVMLPAPVAASDAWDAAQTYFADVPGGADEATGEPVSQDEAVEMEPIVEAASFLADEEREVGATIVDESDAPWALGMTDSPDPSGAFSFGEDDVLADAVPEGSADSEISAGEVLAEASIAESGEKTALFDFGSFDEIATDPHRDAESDGSEASSAEIELVMPSEPETASLEPGDPIATPAEASAAAAGADTAARMGPKRKPDLGAWRASGGRETPLARPGPDSHAGWIIQRDGRLDGVVAWEQDILHVGRADGCDIVLAARGVSRRHASFERSDEGYRVRDEGSANGTWVNAERVDPQAALRVGDVVRIEDFELTFVLDHQPIASDVCVTGSVPQGNPQEAPPATLEVDLLDEEEDDDGDKVLEEANATTMDRTQINAQQPIQEVVRVDIEVPRDSLPPALRLAMEEAGEESLHLPAEVRIRLR